MDPFKQELNDYIESELKAIEENTTLDKNTLMGMRAVYLSIKNIFFWGGEE